MQKLLGNLPTSLRKELIDEFNKLVKSYRESKWEPSEMSGGKMCEIVYSILDGHVNGAYPAHASKPANMVAACRALETAPKTFEHTVRILIPRVLIALYDVRNNRGAGHVGGDVDPNHMDATFVLNTAKWLMSELIRLFHSVSTDEAQAAVELLAERETPMIWNVNGKKRVLKTSLSKSAQTLVLLHPTTEAKDEDLFTWVEYSNFSVYKSKVLKPGHKQRLWEYDTGTGVVTLSALGVLEAEKPLSAGM
jgi:hypothetical protein